MKKLIYEIGSFLSLAARTSSAARLLVAVAMIFALGGCASTVPEAPEQAQKSLLVWPAPPELARIVFVQTIKKPADIGVKKGFFSKVWDFVAGEKFEEIGKPYGVAVDSKGRLIVADTGLKKVHIFDRRGVKYSSFGSEGDVKFQLPIIVVTDGEDNIYVSDPEAAKVFVFDKDGKFLRSVDDMKKPTGLAYDKKTKLLYVSDTGNNEIRVYDGNAKVVRVIGRGGTDFGEFHAPVDLYVDGAGNLYVNDALNFRVQVFDASGKFVRAFGRHGDGTGDMGRTKGLAMDSEGNLYVVDAIFDTVQIFNAKGEFLLNFGSYGYDRKSLNMPGGIFIDNDNFIYVADTYNARVQVYEYVGDQSR